MEFRMSRVLLLRVLQFDVDPTSKVKLMNNLNAKKNCLRQRMTGSFGIFTN